MDYMENLTPTERMLSKNKEAAKVTIAKIEHAKAVEVTREVTIEVTNEIARNAIRAGLDNALITTLTGLSAEQIDQLRADHL
jgi:hypothetical protein